MKPINERQRFFRKAFLFITLILIVIIITGWLLLSGHPLAILDVWLEPKTTRYNPSIIQQKNQVLGQKTATLFNDWDFYPGDYSQQGIIGNSLPGSWRPYLANSPWNTPITADALTHPNSKRIINFAQQQAPYLRLVKIYNSPIWVVNSDNMPKQKIKSMKIFDTWDQDRDNWTDINVPITPEMWGEPTKDGHMIIIDPFKMKAWEMSRFKWINSPHGKIPRSSTFNVWDLNAKGYANPLEGKRWHQRGGRGSGFPVLAGLIRPEELKQGEIRHALMFNFTPTRKGQGDKELFIAPPACRSDGQGEGGQYPIQGMRFQLNPELGDADFERWGLSREGKIIAIALQQYGMYLADDGGEMSIGVQLLEPSQMGNLRRWEQLFPGLYRSVKRIPTAALRVVFTGFAREE